MVIVSLTSESSPRVINMMKKRMAQRADTGIRVTASGYTMKARPTPTKVKVKVLGL